MWRLNNRLLKLIDSFNRETVFQHDALGNLLSARYSDNTFELRMPDAVGNLFKTTQQKDREYGPAGQLLATHSAKGTTRYEYDAEGNLIRKTDPGDRIWRYEWNGAGMMAKVIRPDGKEVTFEYDAFGRRIKKTFNNKITRWVWDGHNPLHEWIEYQNHSTENQSFAQLQTNADDIAISQRRAQLQSLEPQGPPARFNQGTKEQPITWLFEPDSFAPMAKLIGDEHYSIVNDHLGTPSVIFDKTGEHVWSADITVWGELRNLRGEKDFCPFRFPGQYEDSETGLYYNRFRYFDPEAGQYVNQDPIALAGGTNFYGYVKNSTTISDPLGLSGTPLTFNDLKNLAESGLDFSTKRDGAVFWATPNMEVAQAWAAANGKTTLEQTAGGQVLDKMNLFGKGSPVTPAQAKEIWDIASRRFAEGASGEVNVFSTGATRFSPFGERTWWKIEREALMANPDVHRITRRKRDGTPSKNGHVCK